MDVCESALLKCFPNYSEKIVSIFSRNIKENKRCKIRKGQIIVRDGNNVKIRLKYKLPLVNMHEYCKTVNWNKVIERLKEELLDKTCYTFKQNIYSNRNCSYPSNFDNNVNRLLDSFLNKNFLTSQLLELNPMSNSDDPYSVLIIDYSRISKLNIDKYVQFRIVIYRIVSYLFYLLQQTPDCKNFIPSFNLSPEHSDSPTSSIISDLSSNISNFYSNSCDNADIIISDKPFPFSSLNNSYNNNNTNHSKNNTNHSKNNTNHSKNNTNHPKNNTNLHKNNTNNIDEHDEYDEYDDDDEYDDIDDIKNGNNNKNNDIENYSDEDNEDNDNNENDDENDDENDEYDNNIQDRGNENDDIEKENVENNDENRSNGPINTQAGLNPITNIITNSITNTMINPISNPIFGPLINPIINPITNAVTNAIANPLDRIVNPMANQVTQTIISPINRIIKPTTEIIKPTTEVVNIPSTSYFSIFSNNRTLWIILLLIAIVILIFFLMGYFSYAPVSGKVTPIVTDVSSSMMDQVSSQLNETFMSNTSYQFTDNISNGFSNLLLTNIYR